MLRQNSAPTARWKPHVIALVIGVLATLLASLLWQRLYADPDKLKAITAGMDAAAQQAERGDYADAVQTYDTLLRMPEAAKNRSAIQLHQARCFISEADKGSDPVVNLKKALVSLRGARKDAKHVSLVEIATIEREMLRICLRLASWTDTQKFIAEARPVLETLRKRSTALNDPELDLDLELASIDLDLHHALTVRTADPQQAERSLNKALEDIKRALRSSAATFNRVAQARLHTMASVARRQLSDLQRAHRRSHCEAALQSARDAQGVVPAGMDRMVYATARRAEGAAYHCLASISNPLNHLRDARRRYRDSIEIFAAARRMEEVARTRLNLSAAYTLLAEHESPQENLDTAAKLAEESSDFFADDYWAQATAVAFNRAIIELSRAELSGNAQHVETAMNELDRVERIDGDARQKMPVDILRASGRLRLGILQRSRDDIAGGIEDLQRSLPGRSHPYYSSVKTVIGEGYMALAEFENRQQNLALAILNLREVLEDGDTARNQPFSFCNAGALLGDALQRHAILGADSDQWLQAFAVSMASQAFARSIGFGPIDRRFVPLAPRMASPDLAPMRPARAAPR